MQCFSNFPIHMIAACFRGGFPVARLRLWIKADCSSCRQLELDTSQNASHIQKEREWSAKQAQEKTTTPLPRWIFKFIQCFKCIKSIRELTKRYAQNFARIWCKCWKMISDMYFNIKRYKSIWLVTSAKISYISGMKQPIRSCSHNKYHLILVVPHIQDG